MHSAARPLSLVGAGTTAPAFKAVKEVGCHGDGGRSYPCAAAERGGGGGGSSRVGHPSLCPHGVRGERRTACGGSAGTPRTIVRGRVSAASRWPRVIDTPRDGAVWGGGGTRRRWRLGRRGGGVGDGRAGRQWASPPCARRGSHEACGGPTDDSINGRTEAVKYCFFHIFGRRDNKDNS